MTKTILPGIAFLGIAGLLIMLCLTASAASKTSERIGDFRSFKTGEPGVVVEAAQAKIMLTPYGPSVVRVRAVRDKFESDFSYAVVAGAEGKFEVFSEDPDRLVLRTAALEVVVRKKPVRLEFSDLRGRLLGADDSVLGIAWQGTEVTNYKKLFDGERFIGLGEKTGPLDRRGTSYVHWNTDAYGYGPGTDPIYCSTPFYIGLHDGLCYGIFLDNSRRTFFNFGASTDDEFMSFGAEDGEMNYYFISSPSVAGVVEEYTRLTGRMPPPPYWSLGYQQCRWGYYPESEFLNLAQTFREKRIPCDVLYLDIDYMDGYKIFTWHPDRFPDPAAMIRRLKDQGFHTVVIVDPGIKIEPGYFAFDEGARNNYFIVYPGGKPYVGSVWPGRCYFPDFTDARVREWWGRSFERLVKPGVEGFWNDMNEPAAWGQNIPQIVEFSLEGRGGTMKEAHNLYGLLMARGTYEGTKKLLDGKRPFVLTRAGYSGVQRYAAVWTGDNLPSDEHLLLGVRLVNSMGLAGIAFAGPDIGGFGGDPTPALFLRWMSIGTYTPFFRNHVQRGARQKEPWAFGEDVEAAVRDVIERRYELLPYLYSMFDKTARTGLPVARTLAVDWTFDPLVYRTDYQNEYLFGDSILVAPAASTERFVKVYLPPAPGGWTRLSTETHYPGGEETIVEAPLTDLPVFVKAGAIIPRQPVVQFADQNPGPVLDLHVYYGENESRFTYYEDDGITYGYENGIFCRREIRFDPKTREIILGAVQGSFASKFKKARLVLHRFPETGELAVNGAKSEIKTDRSGRQTAEFALDSGEMKVIY